MAGALTGLKIVDMTVVALGPYATMLLAEQGAEVIKVEPPEGDTTRHVGPSKVSKGMGPHHMFVNRNKRSLCLDLKQAPARAALLKVLAAADALIYSIRPQAMARLGLGYEAVRQVIPASATSAPAATPRTGLTGTCRPMTMPSRRCRAWRR
jgi:crotonobetainyl-CoA:carnitine CoA-transferase CaiB-like acyl-CoA transferase